MSCIPLHQTWQIYWLIYPLHQSSIDALHTITPNMADLLADLPPSIKHVDVISIQGNTECPFDTRNMQIVLYRPSTHFHHFYIAFLSLMQLTVCMQLKHSFTIVIIFRCCNFATNCLHTVKMLIWYYHHFLLLSICN